MVNYYNHKSLLLFHILLLLLPQSQLLALFLPPSCYHYSCGTTITPCPLNPSSPLHCPPAVYHLHRALCQLQVGSGPGGHCGDVPGGVLQGVMVMKNHQLTFLSYMVFCGRQKTTSLYSPVLPASFILILPKQRVAQKQYLNLEALWGIRKQYDFSASCITVRKGHSLPLMTFYVHKAMSKELQHTKRKISVVLLFLFIVQHWWGLGMSCCLPPPMNSHGKGVLVKRRQFLVVQKYMVASLRRF